MLEVLIYWIHNISIAVTID